MCAASAANAVLAKARAINGKRLTAANYNELLACRSVNEIASYLKLKTDYAEAFADVAIGALHRRQLESLLHERMYTHFASLCRYERAVGDNFFEYYILKSDIEILLHSVRCLNISIGDDVPLGMPEYFNSEIGLDAETLRNISDIDTLLSRLEGTPYKDLLLPYRTQNGLRPDCFEMELAIMRFYFSRTGELINSCFSFREKKELLDMLRFNVDIENIVSMYRLKKLSGTSGEKLRACLVENDGFIDKKLFEKLLNTSDPEEMLRLLSGTIYSRFAQPNGEYPSMTGKILKYQKYSHSVRFSTSPAAVMLSYVFLAQNEVTNLVHIIEGIRYKMPPDEISFLLIGAGNEKGR